MEISLADIYERHLQGFPLPGLLGRILRHEGSLTLDWRGGRKICFFLISVNFLGHQPHSDVRIMLIPFVAGDPSGPYNNSVLFEFHLMFPNTIPNFIIQPGQFICNCISDLRDREWVSSILINIFLFHIVHQVHLVRGPISKFELGYRRNMVLLLMGCSDDR